MTRILTAWIHRGLIVASVLVASYMGGLVGWLMGMVYGQHRASAFAFAGLKGMDATGAVGGLVGCILLGSLVACIGCWLCRPARP